MEAKRTDRLPLLARPATRRAVMAGTLGAATLAMAYALGARDLLSNGDGARDGAWTPGDAGAGGIEREEVRISHLLRRAGFGVTRDEFERYQSMGLEGTLDELVNYSAINDDEAVRLAGEVEPEGANRRGAVAWWLTRIVHTKRPLQEKMTLFWHGLLTSQLSVVKDPEAMVRQNEFFRANAFAPFPDVLKGIGADPAMMVYLDVAGSQRGAPNENYARELMELFSLGVDNFSEQDVREASRAFTGWRVPRERGDQLPRLLDPVFAPRQHDGGVKTVLGRSGAFGPDDIVDVIVEQPASAEYITRRLFAFFVYPNPDAADLAPFLDVYGSSGRSVGATVEAMLRSEVFYSQRAYRALVKSPVEYVVGAVKALGLQSSLVPSLLAGRGPRGGGVLGEMGQVPMEPPNVAGWPGGASWLNSATVFARLNFIDAITSGEAQARGRLRDRQAAPAAPTASLGTAAQALDYYLPLVLDGNVPQAARDILLDFGGGPDAQLTPQQLRDVVYLILASPQFHLA